MSAYYNEIDPYCVEWLKNLIAAGHIPPGDVDNRSIVDVRPDDLTGYTQCHFFAGLGGWGYAARLAGWPDDRSLWTGSCPCQPFSVAGKQQGQEDARHLWPEFFRLIAGARPAVVMGEQVAAAVGKDWLDGVCSDLEGVGYACRAAVVPACAVDAPHRRDRLWFVADTASARSLPSAHAGVCGREEGTGPRHVELEQYGGALAHADELGEGEGRLQRSGQLCGAGGDTEHCPVADTHCGERFWWSGPLQMGWNCIQGEVTRSGRRHSAQWRVKPGVCLLAHGVPARVAKLRAGGNAIVPQVAAEIIGAYLES